LGYALLASPAGQKSLDALPKAIADGLREVLKALAENPRSKRFDIKALHGPQREPPLLRLRMGDYRVVVVIDHPRQEIVVLRAGRRNTVYRGMGQLGD
jgi:mRNA-degrading endonuclease RelE of RelBE toxin-antitoxin system